MKRYYLIGFLCLMFSLFIYQPSYSLAFKWLRINKFWMQVFDINSNCEAASHQRMGYWYYADYLRYVWNGASWSLGTKDWTDENDTYWSVKISNAPQVSYSETENTMPVPDTDGITLHKYVNFQPPTITVDGFRLDEPFPQEGEEVNPSYITGTADLMIENWLNTSMGITVHQKVFAWSQMNHSGYIIFDLTFTNTGNVDLDDELELQNQTLKDVYYMRSFRATEARDNWQTTYGQFPGDSLRIAYSYGTGRAYNATYDRFGIYRRVYHMIGGKLSRQYGLYPVSMGEATLHCDTSPTDETDNPAQPQMTGLHNTEQPWLRDDSSISSPDQQALLYEIMQIGLKDFAGTPYLEGTYPGTHHGIRQEDMGVAYTRYLPWWEYGTVTVYSVGPFDLGPGESVRMVYAAVCNSLSPQKGDEVYQAWEDGTLEPPEGCVFGVTDNLPNQFKNFPELYEADSKATEYVNWAKDCWVMTGKDSLFKAAWAAQWNIQNNYSAPIAPPPPSIEVKSLPDKIRIEWDGTESEKASDFAGYRIYKAVGATTYTKDGVSGVYEKIYEGGKGTYSFDDADCVRGQAYFYYVTAFDDGVGNTIDVTGKKEVLESGYLYNRTVRGAYLTREAGTLAKARVVPNPFNIASGDLQYIGEPDKIMFIDIPAYCTIKIYTVSGDLVKTLNHTSGSGDESWGDLTEEHSTSETGQIIVSGVYIAHIEENDEDGNPTGDSINLKFVVVR